MNFETKIRGVNILGHTIPMVFYIGIICPNSIQHTNGIQRKTKTKSLTTSNSKQETSILTSQMCSVVVWCKTSWAQWGHNTWGGAQHPGTVGVQHLALWYGVKHPGHNTWACCQKFRLSFFQMLFELQNLFSWPYHCTYSWKWQSVNKVDTSKKSVKRQHNIRNFYCWT